MVILFPVYVRFLPLVLPLSLVSPMPLVKKASPSPSSTRVVVKRARKSVKDTSSMVASKVQPKKWEGTNPFERLCSTFKTFEDYAEVISSCQDSEVKEALEKQMECLYGMDEGSQDWLPKNNLNLREMYTIDFAEDVDDFTEEQRIRKVRYLLHFKLYSALLTILPGDLDSILDEMINPAGQTGITQTEMRRCAVLRTKVIKSQCSSIREFWLQFEEYYQQRVEGNGFEWPFDEPAMLLSQIRDLLGREGDEFGVKMANMLLIIYGDYEGFSVKVASENISWYFDGRYIK